MSVISVRKSETVVPVSRNHPKNPGKLRAASVAIIPPVMQAKDGPIRTGTTTPIAASVKTTMPIGKTMQAKGKLTSVTGTAVGKTARGLGTPSISSDSVITKPIPLRTTSSQVGQRISK